MRRVLRWLLRIGLAAMGIVAVAAIAAVIVIHTNWGRDLLRVRLEAAIAKRFPGGAHIGKIEGSVLGELIVHDIEIDGEDHKPELTIGIAHMRVALLPLLSKTAHFDELVIDDVLVVRKPTPEGDPSTWTIEMPDFEMHRGRVTGAVEAHELRVAGSVRIVPGGESTAAITATAVWRDQRISLTAIARQIGNTVALPLVLVEGAGAHATLLGARLDPASAEGELDVSLPVLAARQLAGIEIIHDARLAVDARAGFADVRARWGTHQVHAFLHPDLAASTTRGLLVGQLADVSPLSGGLASGSATIVAAVDVGVEHLRGIISVDGPVAAAVAIDTSLTHGIVVAGGGNHDGRAAASAVLTRADHQITIDHAQLVAQASAILGVTGALRARLEVSGRVWPPAAVDLKITGLVAGRRVRYDKGKLFAGSFQVHLDDIRQRIAQTSGPLRLEFAGASRAGAALGSGSVGVQLEASTAGTAKLALGAHQIARDGAIWRGRGGVITVDHDRITLSRLHTSQGNGDLTADATLRRSTNDLTAKIDARGIAALSGRFDSTVTMQQRGGQWTGTGKLHGKALVLDVHGPPIDADAEVHLAGRRVTVRATGVTKRGSIKITASVDGPRAITDPLAWKRLDRRALRDLAVELEKIDTGHGVIDGGVSFGPTESRGKLAVRGISAGQLAIDADLELAQAHRGELAVSGTVRNGVLGVATGDAHFTLPVHLFDPKEWRALGAGAFHDATLRVADFAFDQSLLARFGIIAPYHGRLGATATISEAGTTATFVADLRDFSGGVIAKPIDVHLQGGIDDTGVHLAGTALTGNTLVMDLAAKSSISIDQLRPNAYRTIPFTATLAIPSLAGRDLLAIFGRTNVVDGTVSGLAEVTGTIAHAKGHATLTARDVTVAAGVSGRAPAKLRDLSVDARWDGTGLAVFADGHEASGGTLHLKATGEPRRLSTVMASFEAQDFDVAPLAAFAPGPLVGAAGLIDANLNLRGDPRTGDANGHVHLRQARIPLTPKIGTMRDVDADLTLANHQVVATVSGLLGEGDVKGKGTVNLEGGAPRTADATLALHHVSPIGGYEPVIDADVTVHVVRDGRHWKGQLGVRNGHVAVSMTKAQALFDTSAPDDMVFIDAPQLDHQKKAPPPPPTDPVLTLDLDLAPTLVEADLGNRLLDSDSLRTSVSGQVRVTAAKGELGADGELDAESGVAVMFGRRYQIDHAAVRFDGTIDPWLDVRVVHDFPDLTLTASITGRASSPDLQLTSDPAKYTQGQMLGFLLGGVPGGDPGSETRDAAVGGASSAASGLITKQINKLLPLKLDYGYEAGTSASSAAIRVGRWLSAKLFVAYRQHLAARPDENGGEGDAEYYLRENVLIQGNVGDRQYDGIDLLWRKRW
ncbi:MAG: hypothetical protein JWO36_591 [Myxococcales bacterium]|nr:hypothetical protein [Myxococcales bacterium]